MALWHVQEIKYIPPPTPAANDAWRFTLVDKEGTGGIKIELISPAPAPGSTVNSILCNIEARGYTPNDFGQTCA